MRKMKRRPIIRAVLEAKLLKNERRMQSISEESYKIRLLIEQIDATPKQSPLTKADLEKREQTKEETQSLEFQHKPTVDEQIKDAATSVVADKEKDNALQTLPQAES